MKQPPLSLFTSILAQMRSLEFKIYINIKKTHNTSSSANTHKHTHREMNALDAQFNILGDTCLAS